MIVTHTSKQTSGQVRTCRAFTILELIVAISITVIMLLLINTLFQATSNGVSMGMSLSDVIGAGRAISDQIERDADLQLSPGGSPNGVLVIVCQKYTAVPYKFRGKEFTRPVRSDQFMFTRSLGNSANNFSAAPITPINDTTFSSATKTEMAGVEAIRVWYGHVLKTDETGTAASDLGTPGPNQYANQWALGRHALFLVGGTAPTISNYALGATSGSLLAGNVAPGEPLFKGYTDVAYLSYSGDTTVAPGTFVYSGLGVGMASPNTLWDGDAKGAYDSKALAYMFTGGNRLWCNVFPKVNPSNTATWVTAGQIAQMHPLLMDNISDFIVEFAADAIDSTDLPTAGSGPDVFDGEPDRNGAGEVIWYGLETNPDTNSEGPPAWNVRNVAGLATPVVSTGSGTAYVFRHGAANAALWPYMIRIRYRIHDTRAQLAGDPSPEPGDTSNAGRWFEQIIKVRRE